jgi:hypothetical protein
MFDSDIGNRIDSVLALSLLYGLDGKNEIRVISITTSKESIESAQMADMIGRFYAGVITGPFGSFSRALPVGMSVDGQSKDSTAMIKTVLGSKTTDGKPAFSSSIQKFTDTAEVAPLMRNALTAQHDQNAIGLLAGPATDYVRLLELGGAKEWIERKMKFLVVSQSVLSADIVAAKKLFASWPTAIYVPDADFGTKVMYPGSAIEKDFSWSTTPHPVVEAYKSFRSMPYDSPTQDLAAAMYAGRPSAAYFKVSEAGAFTVTDSGKLAFAPGAKGKHFQVSLKDDQAAELAKAYVELTSAKPAPPRRFRPQPQQQQEEKKDEPKPSAAAK